MAKDYIMRLVEQIAAMLAAIIAKRRAGQVAEARQDLDATCGQTVGLTLDAVKQLSPDALAEFLRDSGGNRYPRAVMLAELLIQDAEMLEEAGAVHDALPGYLHAFCLLSDAYPVLSSEEQVIYRTKRDALAGKIEHLPPNPYTTGRLARWSQNIQHLPRQTRDGSAAIAPIAPWASRKASASNIQHPMDSTADGGPGTRTSESEQK